ncbi:MAG: GNAT family N-acetyltransferase [Alphaproteobacteria bacterium]|nr:GNAT family N-acetyltransferase [Alphaproteobacteria bacterium]
MIAHPALVQRPFVATPRGVRLCRPVEQVLGLLDRRPLGDFIGHDVGTVRAAQEPPADLYIRAASPEDIPAITAIYAHAVSNGTASYELTPPGEDEMARRYAALAGSGYPYFVAERTGEVIGYAYAGPFRPRPAYRFMAENSIYLAPDMQGRGVGRRLLVHLIEELEQLGFRQVVAVIGDGRRNQASVRLHEAMGFQQAGVIEGSGFKFGRWLDTLLMQKTLNGGATGLPDPASLPERLFDAGR